MNSLPSLSRSPSCDMWQQWSATAPAKRSTGSLLDDDEDNMDESIMNHMQLLGSGSSSPSMLPPTFGDFPGIPKLESAQSGALPMVALRRSAQS